jgi:hypothetical protein
MKKLIQIFLILLSIGLISCSNKSETVMKNGILIQNEETKFTYKRIGTITSDDYNNPEIYLITIDTVEYIFTISSNGGQTILKR